MARRTVSRGLKRARFDATLSKFFSSLIRWGVLLMGVLAAMSIFGISTTGFAGVLAGMGVGIAHEAGIGIPFPQMDVHVDHPAGTEPK